MAIILVVSKIETASIEVYQQDKPRKARCAGRDLDFGHSTQAPPPPHTHPPTDPHTHTHRNTHTQPATAQKGLYPGQNGPTNDNHTAGSTPEGEGHVNRALDLHSSPWHRLELVILD